MSPARIYPFRWAARFQRIVPALMATAVRPNVQPHEMNGKDIKEMFAAMQFTDVWDDADMRSVLVYLKGNVHLKIPDAWRPYLPTELP